FRMSFNIADKFFTIWTDHINIFAAEIKKDLSSKDADKLFQGILEIFRQNPTLRPNKKSLLVCCNAIANFDMKAKEIRILKRVLTDELLYSRVEIKYSDYIPKIAFRLSKDFHLPLEMLIPVLKGEIPIIDLLYGKYFKDVLMMIEFIKRRRLLD
ncbi:MAG: hypothetical protein ACTSR2_05090, partial [Candidatus Hodarchaeales archaeon]